MKNFSFLIAIFFIAASNAEVLPQIVRLTAETASNIGAQCQSDEFATVELKAIKVSSESSYQVSVKCLPATCLVFNDSGKNDISISRVLAKGGNLSELLKSNVSGGKAGAMAEAQALVKQGTCKSVKYNYTNPVLDFINSL